MARQVRLHVPGGFYHVTLRGNHRQPIFFKESDRDLMDAVVAEVTTKVAARIHAYCWMTNHLHALIQISDVPLGRVVLRIASRYARTVQAHLQTTGHLFERRYHCVLVDADRYLLTLVRYIHLNPVRAGLLSDPVAYRWSSHAVYLGLRKQEWVTTSFAMSLISADPAAALAGYRLLMGRSDSCRWGTGALIPNRNHRQILGDDEFAARIAGVRWQPRSSKKLDELLAECSDRFGVSPALIASKAKNPGLAAARAWLAYAAVSGRVASIRAVARRLAHSERAIRQLMIRYPRNETNR